MRPGAAAACPRRSAARSWACAGKTRRAARRSAGRRPHATPTRTAAARRWHRAGPRAAGRIPAARPRPGAAARRPGSTPQPGPPVRAGQDGYHPVHRVGEVQLPGHVLGEVGKHLVGRGPLAIHQPVGELPEAVPQRLADEGRDFHQGQPLDLLAQQPAASPVPHGQGHEGGGQERRNATNSPLSVPTGTARSSDGRWATPSGFGKVSEVPPGAGSCTCRGRRTRPIVVSPVSRRPAAASERQR